MSNYSSNLKAWGASGSEYPNGYNYVEGEQPVDEWDNFLTDNIIDDLFHLISLTDDRLESESGSSHPSAPEPGHVSHRTDGVVTTDEELFFYDNTNSVWHRLLQADGDQMTGTLDMGGYKVFDSSGELTLEDPSFTGTPEALNAQLDSEWFQNHDGGKISSGSIVPIGTFSLADSETIYITQATLTKDGFTTPCVSGVDLRIVPDSASEGSTTGTTAALSGDGTTLFDDETGSPLASYTNTSGGVQTVIIGLDNGAYGAGYGAAVDAFGSYVSRTV